jgi:Ca2+-binding RTX toxin-like protein
LSVGAGGTLVGYKATVDGNVNLDSGGSISFVDGLIGNFTVTGGIFAHGNGNSLSLDISTDAIDTLAANSFDMDQTAQLAINLNVIGGFDFLAGDIRAIQAMADDRAPSFSVTGEGGNFGFYGGELTSQGNAGTKYLKALNGGHSANDAVLDFGAAGPAASVVYDSIANGGFVHGGNEYVLGYAANIDRFVGTASGDTMIVTGGISRTLTFDGKGGNDTLTGGAGNETLIGDTGSDTLSGNGGNYTMSGGSEADTLTGGAGIDLLDGGTGADTLNGGLDADTLFGGSEADRLFGGAGKDTLFGGTGKDGFYFDTALNKSTNIDAIKDFSHIDDTIFLENLVFKKLTVGVLKAAAFYIGTKAHDASDRIIYNKSTGAVYYDDDGTGAHAQIQFATLSTKPANLAANDFTVI